MSDTKRRSGSNRPWKGNEQTDRKFRRRVQRAIDRGEYTPKGTIPNTAKTLEDYDPEKEYWAVDKLAGDIEYYAPDDEQIAEAIEARR